MRIGRREIPVEVVDESAGGYSILCEQAADCEIGQSLLLRVESNWIIVRIMNVQTKNSKTRLGLIRLRDLDAREVEPEPGFEFSLSSLKSLARALAPLGRPVAGIVALLVGGALLGVLVIVALEQWAPLGSAIKNGDPQRNIEDMALSDPPPFDEHRTSEREPKRRPRKVRKVEPPTPLDPREPIPPADEPTEIVDSENPAPENVVRHSHPGFLLKPEIVKLLDLTREQIAELRRLFEETRSSAADALSVATDSNAIHSQHELEMDLGRRSLAVLTPAQRETVIRMLSSADGVERSGTSASPFNSPPTE